MNLAKGTITSWSCNPATNGLTTAPDLTDYVLGPGGHAVTELGRDANGNMKWHHTNIWAAGALIATYDSNGLHFYLNDWLGTRRVQTDYAGVVEQTCTSLPYGNGLYCGNSLEFPTENHFTGKERDSESGNDYFGARYYSSDAGRFLSPDYVGGGLDPAPVPWASFSNPQTFDLYGYVLDNPLTSTDPDGNDCIVQTRTGDHTEKVTRTSGNCNKVNINPFEGQSKTYIPGVVDMSSLKSNGAGGITFDYTPYSGGAGVADLNGAPYPSSTNLDPFWGNNPQGFHTLHAASNVVNDAAVAVGTSFACVALCADAAAAVPQIANALSGSALDLEARTIAYLESRDIPAIKASLIAMKLLSKFSTIKSGVGALRFYYQEVNQMARDYHQSHGAQ